ncbi:TPA: hypothetical protein EYP44_00795, partial [Candidatus Bathyarchaeota archaeon]|nr:hypothetical protein [Candidatus Bathyarchaeota archaeon]
MGKGFHASSSAAFVLALLSLLSPSVLQQPIPSIKPPTYEPSEGYAEGLGIIPMGADAIVYFVFSNVTLSSGLTAGDLDNVESLVMAFTEGDWRAYWKKPIWGYPQGASLDIAYLNVMENEIGAYVERAKRTAARFIRMFGLPRMVVYKLAFDKEANRLSLGLHSGIKSGADVDACLEVWVNAVPLEGLGSLVDVEGIKASPCKSAAICLRREGDGLTSDVFVAYVRPRAIVGSAETNFTLDTYRVVGTLAASEGARHSIVAVMFPYPVRISECEPEPTYPYVEEWDKWGKREWGREWIRDLIMEYGSPEKWRMWREFAREFGFKRSPDERFESMFKERMKGVGRQMSERAERVMESLWKRREGLERKLRIRERLEEIKRRPEEVPIKEWEEEAGLESEYRRNTYAHQGMLAYDLGEEATENILVRYDLAYDPDLLRARPVIMAEAEPVDDLAAIRIKLENAGNETAYMIIVRPLAFPFAKLGEEVLRAGGLPELGRSYRAFIGGIASLAEPIRKLEPGESVIINQTICPKRWRGEFFSHVQALYNPTGCLVLYTDAFHRRYFTTSNGFLAGIEREEKPLLIPTLRLDKYVITAGEEINGELVVRNIGGLDAANISMTVFTAPLFGKRIGLMPLAGIRFRGHRKHAREAFEAFLEEEDVEEARKWACFHSTVLAHDENVKISAGSE